MVSANKHYDFVMTDAMCLADHLTAPTFFGTLSDYIKIGL